MKNTLLVNKESENSKKAEKYIFKYLNELKIHFNLSDNQIIKILNSIVLKLKKKSNNQNWWKILFKQNNHKS